MQAIVTVRRLPAFIQLGLGLLLFAVCLQLAACAESSSPIVQRLFKRGLTDDAERFLRQGSQVDSNNVGQLIDLVERNGADDCLARVICELSQNSKSHGEPGVRFGQSLLKFRQSKHPKARRFMDAMALGAKARSGHECLGHYTRCTHSTNEVISVGNRILRSN